MFKKILLYLNVLNKGELAKRFEYKIKDLFGYFYLKNKFFSNKKQVTCNIPTISIENNSNGNTDSFVFFNKKVKYTNLFDELTTTDKFWRKYNISDYKNIKELWEINRLQFLLPISLNNKDLSIELLDDWIKKNKYNYSINWTNNLEVAIRAINIYFYLIILNDNNISKNYSNLLYKHGEYIYNEINYSKKCIPNNHLIGEATALLLLGNAFNNKKWINRSTKIYKKFNSIINDDGMSKENSFSYQWFVTKMFIIALPYINDNDLFDTIYNKTINSLQLLKMGTLNDHTCVNYGDNDGGYLFSFESEYSIGKDINKYFNYIFNNDTDNETFFIDSIYKYLKKNIKYDEHIKDRTLFYNKNIFIYKNKKFLLFFNAKDIVGHAHNDSLAINLFVDGEEVIFDSGTYCYDLDKEKRDYYISRNAHSTILFEEKNAIHVGTFRWKNCNKSYIDDVIVNDETIKVSGIIDNICRRIITININNGTIGVKDESLTDNQICSNWIVSDAKSKDSKITNKFIDIVFKNSKIINKKVSVSKRFLIENNANCFTNCDNNDNITIIIKE